MSSHVVEYEWERDDCIVAIEILYEWSRPVPATYLDPPEGGIELDCITAKSIKWHDDPERQADFEELDEAERAFPSDKAWELAEQDHAERDEAARERAAEY